jgi:ribosomal protein L11 methylase PrmA
MDKWQELTITVNREAEEAASNILIECGSQGVVIDDSAVWRSFSRGGTSGNGYHYCLLS